jgi:maleate cis-trans isomerase
MFEDVLPKRKLGVLSPLSVIENGPYEFYRVAPPGVSMVLVPCGIREFSAQDLARVFEPLDALVDQLTERSVDIIINTGAPLSVLIGVDAHDDFLARIAARAGKPAASTVTAAVAAARHLGLRSIALVNKWDTTMNERLGAFFERAGIEVAGTATEVLPITEFQGMASADSIELAYALGRQAFEQFTQADGLYIGGGTWLSQPVCEQLEREFGKPCLSNLSVVLWDALRTVDYWTPMTDHGMLLASN